MSDSAGPRAQAAGPAGRAESLMPAVALATIALAARVAALAGRETEVLIDDAFISFRYARNLAGGGGMVFNPGERVEGFTNFLWTLTLAGCARLGLDIPSASVVLAWFATCGTIITLAAFGRRIFAGQPHARALTFAAPLWFALMGCQSRYVLSGMETSSFVLFVTLATYAYVAAWPPMVTGVLFAIATLSRPEGGAYFGVVLLYELSMAGRPFAARMRSTVWLVAGFAVLIAPYTWWRWSYFGSIVPNTVYAKTNATVTSALVQRGWANLVYAVRESSLEIAIALGLLALLRVRREPFWVLLWGLVGTAAAEMVLVGGDFQFFFGPRLLMPALPPLLLAAATGVAVVQGFAANVRVAQTIGAIAIAGLAVNAWWYSWPGRDGTLAFVSEINRGWTELGRWLKANTAADAVVAVGAVGRIPYYSERVTIDMLGLTDVHIARVKVPLGGGMPGHEKYDTPYVLGRMPDYVIFVLLDAQGQPAVQDWSAVADDFLGHYGLIALAKASATPGPLVLETAGWSPDLAARGYLAGVYRRLPPTPPPLPGFAPVR